MIEIKYSGCPGGKVGLFIIEDTNIGINNQILIGSIQIQLFNYFLCISSKTVNL